MHQNLCFNSADNQGNQGNEINKNHIYFYLPFNILSFTKTFFLLIHTSIHLYTTIYII